MPPAISDEEVSGSEEEIPYRNKPTNDDKKDAGEDAEEEAEDDAKENGEGGGDDEGEEEYVVEKIISHAFDVDGVCKYEVKWLGYEKKSDRTWEPEANLSGAKEVLNAYHKKIGGRPEPGSKKKRKQSTGTPAEPKSTGRSRKKQKGSDDGNSVTPAKRPKEAKQWEPPQGMWEDDVLSVESVEQKPNPKTGQMELHAFILWNSQKKTQHPLNIVYKKCPQKYYESHLVFKDGEYINGGAEEGEDGKDE
ncbi:hypothetical protein K432DRAFT_11089 [Lepidopterella palustris CBS 459.81]|uniref:Chromo domain-containing protein n=1 Tax=Lepidopterella palustris CBS 459.81 TaxID=1314670 RepID=A0A8E2ECT0_9PEZI|nr:hypothetical protein K432DRAFT_11089 [Lepidopterella palustris CBS 459.81]